jgi:polar amino acid transport system substrate-binding protein
MLSTALLYKYRVLLTCLFSAATLVGCSKKTAPVDAANKVYAVGVDAAYAPFEYQNEKGELVGFSIDLANAIAAKAGIKIKFVNTPWEGIFNTLTQGDRDFLISSITITQERKQTMDFTEPYFDAQQLIAVKEGSAVKGFNDLAAQKVGVQTGTTGDEVVTKLQGKTSTNINAGGVDAVVADNGVIINYVKNNSAGKLRTVNDTSFTPEQYGIAVKKGNTELLAKLNQALTAVKADDSYQQIYDKYFAAAK